MDVLTPLDHAERAGLAIQLIGDRIRITGPKKAADDSDVLRDMKGVTSVDHADPCRNLQTAFAHGRDVRPCRRRVRRLYQPASLLTLANTAQ